MKITEQFNDDSKSVTVVEPSNLTTDYPHQLLLTAYVDTPLFMDGRFGKMWKHLPAKTTSTITTIMGETTIVDAYDYTIEGGRIMAYTKTRTTTMNIASIQKEDLAVYSYVYTWQKK